MTAARAWTDRMPGAVTLLRAGRDHLQAWRWARDRQRLSRRLVQATASGQPAVLDVTLRRRGIGMFAELNWVVYVLAYARSLGMRPRVRVSSETYFDPAAGHDDWLEHLFDVSWRVGPSADERVVAVDLEHLHQLPDYDGRVGPMSLSAAHAIAAEFLQPSPAVRATAAEFVRTHLGSHYLALHWRGTDKVLEAPPVSLDDVAHWIDRVVRSLERPPTALFVASDDRRLVAAVRSRMSTVLPGVSVVSRHEETKSADGRPLHLQGGREGAARRALGEDALVDCLLLAGGVALVRTASFLSGWCSVFAPTLPVYLMNAPYPSALWFPDREVVTWAEACVARLEAR